MYYEVTVVYNRQTGEDNPAKVKETYLVQALLPAVAEQCVLQEITPFITGDYEIQKIVKKSFFDILRSGAGQWYKGRVEFITIEEDGRESRKPAVILIEADNCKKATLKLYEQTSHLDCEITGVQKTPILEVFQ